MSSTLPSGICTLHENRDEPATMKKVELTAYCEPSATRFTEIQRERNREIETERQRVRMTDRRSVSLIQKRGRNYTPAGDQTRGIKQYLRCIIPPFSQRDHSATPPAKQKRNHPISDVAFRKLTGTRFTDHVNSMDLDA